MKATPPREIRSLTRGRSAVADGPVRRSVGAWPRGHDGRQARSESAIQRSSPHACSDNGSRGVSEIADADPPFTPKGCPFQAWSLGELLRLDRLILAQPKRRGRTRKVAQQAV